MSEVEKFSDVIGDVWTFTAIMPVEKLILGHITGKRTKINAHKLVALIKSRSKKEGKRLYITSDGNDDYTDGISSVYGNLNSQTHDFEMPENLCYAQVIKTIEKGKCTAVARKQIFGTEKLLSECLESSLVSYGINTAFIERSNLTIRQHNHRVERKSQGFSKEFEYLKGHNSLVIGYYNLCLPHSSLLSYCDGRPIPTTPAMAANVTKKSWSMEDLLSVAARYD